MDAFGFSYFIGGILSFSLLTCVSLFPVLFFKQSKDLRCVFFVFVVCLVYFWLKRSIPSNNLCIWVTMNSQECWVGDHGEWGVGLAIAAIVVYAFGVPFFTWLSLYRARKGMWDKKHAQHVGIARRYGNLFQQYEPKYWYWECIEMVRKLLLTGGMVLAADGKCSFRLDDTCWWYFFFKKTFTVPTMKTHPFIRACLEFNFIGECNDE